LIAAIALGIKKLESPLGNNSSYWQELQLERM
jgi:hypothetical protein